jgi:cyclopropane fatty-acyl-phospholipid synthase-like methyltransferase
MSSDAVKHIYDALFSLDKNKKGGESYPIHKPLDFKDGHTDITDWIQQHISIADGAAILDAGCGTGFTLLELCKDTNIKGLGISLSQDEVQRANASAEKRGIEERCSFKVHDFGEPLNQKFDLIFAIESLKHSPDIKKTFANLVAHLNDKGRIIIMEDYYIPNKVSDKLGNKFLENWSVGELYTADFYINEFKELNAHLIHQNDFTDLVFKKNKLITRGFISGVGLLSKIIPTGKNKSLARIYQGGLIMDYFYKVGAFEYKMLVFEK